jgi:alpha-glucosidase
MSIRYYLLFAVWLALAIHCGRAADSPGPKPEGISFWVGNASVTLEVASPHAFRLHIAYAAPANPRFSGPDASIYLAPATPGPLPAVTNISDVSTMGIKTSFGSLQVDPRTAKWRLLEANGRVLANWAPLRAPEERERSGPEVNCAIGCGPPGLFYGSGNLPATGALTQVKSGDRMGNGTAVLPQYWNSAGYGVLVVGPEGDHPAGWVRMPDGSVDWTVPGSSADIYLMPAPTLSDWLRDVSELTGFAPVPPRWAFGYMQSRWGWTDRKYIDDTLAHFRRDELPVDAFIFDFEWYTKKPDYEVPPEGDPKFVDFGWNPSLFPDPAGQIAGWLKQGLHVIGIRKPRLGNTDTLAMARKEGWINPGDLNDHYEGKTRFRNIDFSQPAARTYWAETNRKFLEAGMAGFWNDEGETTYTKYSYWNLAETDLLRQVRPDGRFFSLNRSFIPGMQPFGAAVWTGDIAGDWPTLQRTPGELLSFSLAGMPYSTCDIGGFFKNASPELMVRWMEAGVFFPIMRSHSTREIAPHFPWLYGTDAENAIRKALDLRYRLVPYYYSLAHEARQTGAPLMRPLVMEFPDDPPAAGITDEWLMGRRLLVAPILSPGGTREVYLPGDTWYEFGSSRVHVHDRTKLERPLDFIPIYVRAGTLLPLGPVLQYTGQPSSEPLEMQIYPGRDATFTLVEDDGETTAYQHGVVRETTFTWDDQKRRLSWKVAGPYAGANAFAAMKAVLFGTQSPTRKSAPLGRDGELQFP